MIKIDLTASNIETLLKVGGKIIRFDEFVITCNETDDRAIEYKAKAELALIKDGLVKPSNMGHAILLGFLDTTEKYSQVSSSFWVSYFETKSNVL